MNNWCDSQFLLQKRIYESELFAAINLTPSAKLFLWALCSHFNPKHSTMFPSQATVAKRLGMSERSAERAVKELRENGLIDYVTKRVNHYVFSEKFFSLVKGENQSIQAFEAYTEGKNSSDENFKSDKLSGEAHKNRDKIDKMSGEFGHFVGSKPRQNVGLTNKKEQKKKGNFSSFSSGASASQFAANYGGGNTEKKNSEYRYNPYTASNYSKNGMTMKVYNGVKKYYQDGGKAVPSIEETRKYIEEGEKIRAQGFTPLNYTKEEALNWLSHADFAYLRYSGIARTLIQKYELEDYYYLLQYEKA